MILVPIVFWCLARKVGAIGAFYWCCLAPLLVFILAVGVQKTFGYGFMAHALFHFAYDTSYVLTLTGLLLCLYFLFKRRRVPELALALIPAVAPLLYLLFW